MPNLHPKVSATMKEDRKVLIMVLNDVNDEVLLETTLLIDLILGSDKVLMKKIDSNGVDLLGIDKSDVLIFWISEINHETEYILRNRKGLNPSLVIYDGNSRLNVRQIIHTNVNGVISSNSLSELPRALNELYNEGYFLCQESLKNILGKVSKERVDKILSRRELEVLNLLSHGMTYQEISSKLHISYDTTKTHTYNIYRKLGARNKAEAVHKARVWMILS